MGRIRTIKPEIWMTPRFAGLTCEARLLYIGALNFVDDWGRHPADPMALRLAIFPGAAIDVGPLSDELTAAGLWGIYVTDAGRFVQVLGFLRHQRVDRRQPARWPEPTADNSEQDVPARWRLFFADLLALKKKKGIADDSPDDSTNDRRMIDERSTNDRRTIDERSYKKAQEGKGGEGKGTDQGKDQGGGGTIPPRVLFPLGRKGKKELPAEFVAELCAEYGESEAIAELERLGNWVQGNENGKRPENLESWIMEKFRADRNKLGASRGPPPLVDPAKVREFLDGGAT